jgi:hypothetical protein
VSIIPILINCVFEDELSSESQVILEDFLAIVLQNFPTHLFRENAVNYNCVVTSKNAKKNASGRIVGYEEAKNRYVVKLDLEEQKTVLVKWENIEFGTWGSYEETPLLTECFLTPILLGQDMDVGPLNILEAFYNNNFETKFEAQLLRGKLSMGLVRLLDADQEKKRCLLGTSKAIIEIFCYRNMEKKFLDKVMRVFVAEEVENTESLGTLFRGNSVATRVISAFIDVVGSAMLKECLSACMEDLVSFDLERIRKMEAAQADGTEEETDEPPYPFIAEMAKMFIDRILDFADLLPKAVRRCCALCAEIVTEKFADDEEFSQRLCVGNIIFLRYIIPAIMSPVEAELLPAGTVLSGSVQSVLKNLTSSIQCLANQTTFSEAKPSFVLNELFLEKEKVRVNEFLDSIVAIEEGEPSASVSAETYNLAFSRVVTSAYILGPEDLRLFLKKKSEK